jgi:thiamine biosynthesis protein ThiS
VISVTVNGETREFPERSTLAEMITMLSLSDKLVAVERNHEVTRKDEWSDVRLSDGDKIEVVHFVGGG